MLLPVGATNRLVHVTLRTTKSVEDSLLLELGEFDPSERVEHIAGVRFLRAEEKWGRGKRG